ncbi:hypothetical protein CDD81_4059 [Ophiocordyceps australis]|uniref:tRNA-splicing endonuclease subunit Sen15 domain-containing protein n=1 Tax=Ophiocordyceps australis TaxID=1399860 RepID=A0A2C5XDU6_9HYPO|nr:hypothetical protein CDD81_4059 [Ophiocordyceps australis]
MQRHMGAVNGVTACVLYNLEHQHDWTALEVCDSNGNKTRPLIRGLPPRRLYTHPDDQMAALAYERQNGQRPDERIEREWVLPVGLIEKWSFASFSAVFDSVPEPTGGGSTSGTSRGKRIVLAAVDADSTVVYYLMHNSMVKPRQN